MLNKIALLLSIFVLTLPAFAQKKSLDHADFAIWKAIEQSKMSADGNWVSYVLEVGEGQRDNILVLYDAQKAREIRFDRAEEAHFSADNRFAVFRIKPPIDTLKAMRRKKVDKEKLPKDTLAIYNLQTGAIEKIPNLKSYQLPEKWAGWLAYQYEAIKTDSTAQENGEKKKKGKKSKDSGDPLVIRQLGATAQHHFEGVTHYTYAKEGSRFLFNSKGEDSTFLAGVYFFDTQNASLKPLLRHAKGKFAQLTLDDQGQQAAFIADLDTTKVEIRPFALYYWETEQDSAEQVLISGDAFLKNDWMVSEHYNLKFADDGSRLYFGIAPPPILQDTSLLEEEIVNVEVWSYTDPRLHTQQKVQLEKDKKKSYLSIYYPENGQLVQVGSQAIPEVTLNSDRNATVALGYDDELYKKAISWDGYPICKDIYLLDLTSGKASLIANEVCGNPELSPAGKYIYWYSQPDSAWFAYSIANKQKVQITNNSAWPFYDELNDRPMHPDDYGIAGWLKDDAYILINDRYDIWKVDPSGKQKRINLTKGRTKTKRYRYVQTDPEAHFIDGNQALLTHTVNETSKEEGYAWLQQDKASVNQIVEEDFSYSSRPAKARNANKWLFTKESFVQFPDLHYGTSLDKAKQISHANPQQKDYFWGSIEPYQWTSLDGQLLDGLLIKPEGFDAKQQYPMITYFYERSSHTLHNHRHPYPGRSIINFTFYASRGYVIFVPDIPYREGYPGESAYNAVIPGVTSLIDRGFIDKERIGVQGHSWGGYQSAYLITKTDIFKCAESGAPVVNMFSAYGGIRWGSGLSRMFQYEKTQSRIGGTIWEYPIRYLENSPLFFLDKVNTPVLILHNDHDSAVPWYQGIEFFTAMRRLGKPAWLLNYNGEPHWPVKLQNRQDFQKRMQQFFDYYLKDAPLPMWMERGVPAIEKGVKQGYENADGKH